MTLKEFLLKKTKVGELCIITDCGYKVGAVWIDHEDLWLGSMHHTLLLHEVKEDCWGSLIVTGKDGIHDVAPAHYIAI